MAFIGLFGKWKFCYLFVQATLHPPLPQALKTLLGVVPPKLPPQVGICLKILHAKKQTICEDSMVSSMIFHFLSFNLSGFDKVNTKKIIQFVKFISKTCVSTV